MTVMAATKEQIQQEYQALTSKVGDLYFAIEGHKGQLRALENQMAQYHEQRNAIQAAFLKTVEGSTSADTGAGGTEPAPDADKVS